MTGDLQTTHAPSTAHPAPTPVTPPDCPSPQFPSQILTAAHTSQKRRAKVKHLPRPLTQPQLNAIELILQGRSDSDVATAVSVDRCTINRWRNQNPKFRQALARRRAAVQDHAADRFRALLSQAIQRFAVDLDSPDDRTRFRAAATLLSEAGKNRFAPPDPTPRQDVILRALCSPPIENQNSKIENRTQENRPGIA